MPEHWQLIADNVFRFRDSCHVYAVTGDTGTVLINAGTGMAAERLGEIDTAPDLTVLLTHHFRDHSDGAIRLHAAGATVLGPYWDQEYLVDPEQHFRERQTWNSYDNRWDRYAPVRPLPVSDWMMDYETRTIAGRDWTVVPTPGVSNGAASYAVTVNGRRLAFVGEIICGDGRVPRLAPLQYNYNDMHGAVNIWHSTKRLLETGAELLLPSRGDVVADPAAAVATLRQRLQILDNISRDMEMLADPDDDDIEQILPHLYRSKYGSAMTHFVVSDTGKVLSLDYGYNSSACIAPGKQHRSNRRPFLHGLSGLKQHTGTGRINTVLVSHFHDDHVNGIPLLQRVLGTEVWAADNFADILERPMRYDRPCLWHEPIPVARRLPCNRAFRWENIPITLYPMSGHTRFAALVCLEIDGTRVVHTGDQIFFRMPDGDNVPFTTGALPLANFVYKNGLDIGCYKQALADLKRFEPELVLTGHSLPYRTTPEWYDTIARTAEFFDEAHQLLMPLGDDDCHFGAESQAAKLKPYRVQRRDPGRIEFEGWILNPYPRSATAVIRLVGPDDWQSESCELALAAREQRDMSIYITAPPDTRCRRQPVALDLCVDGQPFGHVTEALVTIGYDYF